VARALAIDYGERRIGLAISDPTSTIAQPLPPLVRRPNRRPPVQAIIDLMDARDVERAVVGLPLSLEGDDTPWTTEVRAFAARLAERSGRDVFLLDERMTSVIAERAVRSLGLKRQERERRTRVDTAAAIVILQAFLDRNRSGVPLERARPAAAVRNGGATATETGE
jgi:putative Holliday junction resolvase